MAENTCSENWHIFEKGADIFVAGTLCKCGKVTTTEEVGKLKPVKKGKV